MLIRLFRIRVVFNLYELLENIPHTAYIKATFLWWYLFFLFLLLSLLLFVRLCHLQILLFMFFDERVNLCLILGSVLLRDLVIVHVVPVIGKQLLLFSTILVISSLV